MVVSFHLLVPPNDFGWLLMENPKTKWMTWGYPMLGNLQMLCRHKLQWPTVADCTERMGRIGKNPRLQIPRKTKHQRLTKGTYCHLNLCFRKQVDCTVSSTSHLCGAGLRVVHQHLHHLAGRLGVKSKL